MSLPRRKRAGSVAKGVPRNSATLPVVNPVTLPKFPTSAVMMASLMARRRKGSWRQGCGEPKRVVLFR